jgi:hypothetical protein
MGVDESRPRLEADEKSVTGGLSCLVTAPAKLQLGGLIDHLSSQGWRAYAFTDVAPLGGKLTDALQQTIESADLVLALFPKDSPSLSVAFEVGMAVALGKPVVAVIPPGAVSMVGLEAALVVQADLDNFDAIGYSLSQIAGRTRSRSPSQSAVALDHPLGPSGRQLLARAERIVEGGTEGNAVDIEREVVELLIQAIEASGAAAVVAAGKDRGYDIGVWSDDLDALGGNPVLIEIKKTLHADGVRQSLYALHQSPTARMALIVYLTRPSGPVSGLSFPVLAINLVDLIAQMQSKSFASVVRDLRNQSVHGPRRDA